MGKISIEIEKGYMLLKNGRGPVYVTLHSGPRFGYTIDRDVHADTIASLCWKETGGTLIMATLPRQQEVGIDLNRDEVGTEKALKSFEEVSGIGAGEYKNVYAWAAYSKKDHKQKKAIYERFWKKVKSSGKVFLLVHSTGMRVGHIPTLVDLITLDGKGISRKKAKHIAEKINKKYKSFFSGQKKRYIKRTLGKQEMELEGMFSKKSAYIYKELLERDTDKIKKYAKPKIARKYLKNPCEETFMPAAESALKNGGVHKVTVESIFSGKKAFGPKKHLLTGNKKAVEVEFNEYLGAYFPEKSAEILKDILKLL